MSTDISDKDGQKLKSKDDLENKKLALDELRLKLSRVEAIDNSVIRRALFTLAIYFAYIGYIVSRNEIVRSLAEDYQLHSIVLLSLFGIILFVSLVPLSLAAFFREHSIGPGRLTLDDKIIKKHDLEEYNDLIRSDYQDAISRNVKNVDMRQRLYKVGLIMFASGSILIAIIIEV